jgi:glycerol-3-phosphate O-acyltransferase
MGGPLPTTTGFRNISLVNTGPDQVLPDEPGWPEEAPTAGGMVVLLDSSSRLERRMLTGWLDRHRPPGVESDLIRLAPSRRRRPGQRTDPRLEARMRGGDDPYLLPLRVVWSPSSRLGVRSASWWDVLKLGDPRDPDAVRQRVILARWPERVTITPGPGAPASRLMADHAAAAEVVSLLDFTTRRAWLALEKAERGLRGNRHKVPKFIDQEILSRAGFRDGAIRFGATRGLTQETAIARARHYLKEMAASHSPFLIDLIANAIHWVYRQGYGSIVYDREHVAEINTLGQEVPLAFLPSHRSNLDRLSLQYLKWENDLPPNHTAGGINMNFFPVGPLLRRTGVFFIRRSFKGNSLYKFVLKSYLDYLIENRFPLEWYLEGGRSRSGKLLPPRLGLLSYAVDSWRRGKAEDLLLIPVSIVYDQIQDLGSYASEARGAGKEKESVGWALSAIRSLRRRYGNIHVRFGYPVSVAKAMTGTEDDEDSTDLAKLGFEVMYRISQVTAITPAAVVAIALLDAQGMARSLGDLASACGELDEFIEQHRLPTTEQLALESPSEVARVLSLLAEHGNVSSFSGIEQVYYLKPDQALRASYYRNVVVHHFILRGIAELALAGLGSGTLAKSEHAFWERVWALRDLLKFEFFFPEKAAFRDQITADLDQSVPGWRRLTPSTLLSRLRPRIAAWAVVPFLEAYLVIADELAALNEDGTFDEKSFVAACLRRGEEYRLKGQISPASVSTIHFRQALALARNRRLIDSRPDGAIARSDFAREVRAVIEVAARLI